ncbi:MAG TPA: hypothetical protein DCP31_21940 [Cyanobacteria bacterium UBA8543]|nr:hypothetical protein [Cyanobacteria bacterium UBA8543]
MYLPPKLYRQLKVRAAVDLDSMSAMVERAIVFYLRHPELVEEVEASYGKRHQVHTCPECRTSVVIKDGEMVSIENQPSLLNEELPVDKVREEVDSQGSQGEEELVPC